ncbi:proteinase inhibitor [Pyrus ussuriensis x Pyrus communis]|uniref:Proteinase inhibitor n=1 Tax=Pyrus ussuriensis x Pyrus communis TaxID=2448454 RepID=A0A5N5H1J9_9ROSA|nr:proteinase inhibitor [Pyrus ussuriensis x Pyrus communis]
MSRPSLPPYPPCFSFCSDAECCGHGLKYVWPELIGKLAWEAATIIKKDNPSVTVLVLKPGFVGLHDFCCNRVYVYTDENGKVFLIPRIG